MYTWRRNACHTGLCLLSSSLNRPLSNPLPQSLAFSDFNTLSTTYHVLVIANIYNEENLRMINFTIELDSQYLCWLNLQASLRYKWAACDISSSTRNHAQQTLISVCYPKRTKIHFTCTADTNRGSKECIGLRIIRHIIICVDQGTRRTGIPNRYRV